MGKTIKLTESMIRNLVVESVKKVINEMDEINGSKMMPARYASMFKNRIINACNGCGGSIEQVVAEFYRDFAKRIPNDMFTMENLMELAAQIEDRECGGSHLVGGAERHGTGDWYWGVNRGALYEGKEMAENKKKAKKNTIRLNESQFRNLIRESVMRVLRESRGNSNGRMYCGGYDVVVDELEKEGVLDSESAERLYADLMNIFDNIELEGMFNCWSYPATREDPEDWGCELLEIENKDEVIDAIQGLQWPDEIKNRVINFFEDWVDAEMHDPSDSWNPWGQDDADPSEYDDRFNDERWRK